MIFMLTIPVIFYLTFRELIQSDFPMISSGQGRSFLEWCFTLAVAFFISLLISLVPIGICALIGSMPEREGISDMKYPLVALRQHDGLKGKCYFLGICSVGDIQYYLWYRRQQGAVVGGKTVRQPGVRLYEQEGESYMETFKTEYKNKSMERWLWIIGLDVRDDCSWCPDFYIPKGSIKEGYVL